MTTDIEACTAALRMMHEEGFSVNDVARFNALIGGAKMTQIDIEAMRKSVDMGHIYSPDIRDILDELEAARAEIARLRGLLDEAYPYLLDGEDTGYPGSGEQTDDLIDLVVLVAAETGKPNPYDEWGERFTEPTIIP